LTAADIARGVLAMMARPEAYAQDRGCLICCRSEGGNPGRQRLMRD